MLLSWNYFQKLKNFKNSSRSIDLNNNNSFDAGAKYSKHFEDDLQKIEEEKKAQIVPEIQVEKVNNVMPAPSQMPPRSCAQNPARSRCPFFIKVKNIEDSSSLQDTLHHRSAKHLPCKPSVCQGSIMNPKCLSRGPRDKPVPADEILVQAIEFVNQYYQSFKQPRTEDHLARVEAVTMEIEKTGTYQLTFDELAFAAKQAWRNAPRCIGRIQWANLQVFDARQCTTTKEMFEFLCNHLKYATNEGNLRSAITVFPQRSDGQHDFRVWNGQLVKYAGYQMPDGTVLGDPTSLEFTELCVQLGWKPRYGRFDVLPLVLQANGEDPELFEIPPELILEVPMEHPQYEWFKELDLKWYAMPAVSNMLLEVGGLEFTACPFNGWYMGTEIGVRDFCDANRYNILEDVGRRMGLETHRLSSLWKDQALVAINVAVIHSFQKHNVTIMDHHSAAESFMKHMHNEFRLRGGCPADWVWLVPPMSGSLTPVFHQEMVSYILSPFYYYQPDPMTVHVWKDEQKRPKKRKIYFRDLARAVFFTSSLMRKVMAARVKATVLYATETGKSETFAKKLNTMLNCAFNSRVLCMEDYDFTDLEKETFLVIVTSTFGNGDSPGNGETFKKSLFALKRLKNKLRYCVFGLGSRMYPQFCAFAHAVDKKLADLGAQRLTLTGEGDEMGGQEEAFSSWAGVAFKDACETFDIRGQLNIQLPGSDRLSNTWDPKRYRLANESQTLDLINALSTIHSKDVFAMKLKKRHNLQSLHSSRSTILVELVRHGTQDLRYLPGEHIGVLPGNCAQLVSGVSEHLNDAPPSNQTLRLEVCPSTSKGGAADWETDTRFPACTLSQALTYFLDITAPPSQSLLRKLAQLAAEDSHRERLLTLAQDTKEYNTWKTFNSPTFLEVLEEFPSLQLPTTFLLSQLPLLKPRFYSVSSSVDRHPGEIHLTVAVVRYNTRDGQGPLHHGVCSTWLDTIKEGDVVPCFIRSANGFHLPEDPTAPAILVGPGTGIAPFRSFWQQRLHDLETRGVRAAPMTLVFGCRQSNTDHLYRKETLELKRRGILKDAITAYSRQPGQPKVYVQDVLRDRLSEEVVRVLHQQQGHIYICGDVRMARDVEETLAQILAHKLGMSLEQAVNYLSQLKTEKRYHEDIFGAVFQK
uniref:Nitric oxide synthase n=1 Tax=Lepisosteus oculatus TaxID=7918 RepID=W5MEJ4_LEPOC|nr:PREDICTED: nitric oxide synthase, inducible [Lepisosteus oculatus]